LPRRRPPGNRPQSLKAPASAQLGSLRPGAPSFAGAPHLTRHKSGCLSSGIPTDRSSSVGRRSGFSDLGNHEPRPSVSHFQTSRLSQIAISPCRKKPPVREYWQGVEARQKEIVSTGIWRRAPPTPFYIFKTLQVINSLTARCLVLSRTLGDEAAHRRLQSPDLPQSGTPPRRAEFLIGWTSYRRRAAHRLSKPRWSLSLGRLAAAILVAAQAVDLSSVCDALAVGATIFRFFGGRTGAGRICAFLGSVGHNFPFSVRSVTFRFGAHIGTMPKPT